MMRMIAGLRLHVQVAGRSYKGRSGMEERFTFWLFLLKRMVCPTKPYAIAGSVICISSNSIGEKFFKDEFPHE